MDQKTTAKFVALLPNGASDDEKEHWVETLNANYEAKGIDLDRLYRLLLGLVEVDREIKESSTKARDVLEERDQVVKGLLKYGRKLKDIYEAEVPFLRGEPSLALTLPLKWNLETYELLIPLLEALEDERHISPHADLQLRGRPKQYWRALGDQELSDLGIGRERRTELYQFLRLSSPRQ